MRVILRIKIMLRKWRCKNDVGVSPSNVVGRRHYLCSLTLMVFLSQSQRRFFLLGVRLFRLTVVTVNKVRILNKDSLHLFYRILMKKDHALNAKYR